MKESAGPSFLELVEAWDGVGVVVRHDRPTGTWIFIALHDDTLGPPTGGCRMKVYPRPEDGLKDALRLAEGMTQKWAGIDFPYGGGKAVLAVARPLAGEERKGLFRRFGALLNSLHGAYGTGGDMGTTPDDMKEIASVSEYVIGIHGRTDGPMDPGAFTAIGVFAGIRAALARATGSSDVTGRTVLVQGVGGVGMPLARRLAEAGAQLVLSDVAQKRVSELAKELGASVVSSEDVYDTPCDVYAPCAVGATLNRETIPRLRCSIVAGSANNQLEFPEDADRLHERGILYAPDYVINAGGAMSFTLIYAGEERVPELERRVSAIGDTLQRVFSEAERLDVSPVVAAQERVRSVLARAAAER